jgi:hypothetical protein
VSESVGDVASGLVSSRAATATTVDAIGSSSATSPTVHRFCITHTQPLIPECAYDDCIALGGYQPDSASHISRLDQFWHDARPIAYGAAGTHVLPIAIEKFAHDADLIEISLQRKRILLTPHGVASDAYQTSTIRELTVKECGANTELSSVIIPPNNSGFLVARPLYFDDLVIGQHARCFHCIDLLDYTSLAIEMGVLDNQSSVEFLIAKQFIPGGIEFGIFPKSWLVPALSQIEHVSREFLSRYGDRVRSYNQYQVRAVAFLSERLGSFMLLRHLSEMHPNGIPTDIFGYMTCIVEENSPYSLGVAG